VCVCVFAKNALAARGAYKSKELIRTRCGRIARIINIYSVCFCERGSLGAGGAVNLERNNRTDYKVSYGSKRTGDAER
jgi:hypothetical protein